MNREFTFDYTKFEPLNKLSVADKELVDAARGACDKAYAPYSNFKVGAAARLQSGRIITGSNQESEVFPAGICAERNLLFHHQSHMSEDKITAIAIASDPNERECYPCGICRQVINDVQKRQQMSIKVIMSGADSATVVETATYLLPFTFEL